MLDRVSDGIFVRIFSRVKLLDTSKLNVLSELDRILDAMKR